MQSSMWLFHFKSLDIVAPSIFAQTWTGSSFPSILKRGTLSLHLSAFTCTRWDRHQSSTVVTACCTSPRKPWCIVWDCRFVHILLRESVNLEIIDYKQKKPSAEISPLKISCRDWAPPREAFWGELDALVSICPKVSHPGFDAMRHVKVIYLSVKYLMIDKVKGFSVIK